MSATPGSRRGLLASLAALVLVASYVRWAPIANAATGDTHEFSSGISSGSGPFGIAAGPDGNLWFTEFDGNRIGRITPAGVVTEFSTGISPGAAPDGIAAGPDGNLWFTEPGIDRIGKITPSGAVTEFSMGITAGSKPLMIAAGPDGNMWFTEFAGDRIGRITPAGKVRQFSAGIDAASQPIGIAAGRDGNLWFAQDAGNEIGRITTAGVVKEFSSGITTGGRPHIITAGPDGKLWFTEYGTSKIARISTSGVVAEFSSGITSGSNPMGIAAGPDGNLWFTEESKDKIGRITPAGVVTEFSSGITAASRPELIAAGPDGNLWFTENAGRVGRAHAAQAATAYDLVRDFSFVRKSPVVTQGTSVKWMFLGPNPHTATDTTGMRLFNSGPRSMVSYFSKRFDSGGTYSFHCSIHPARMTGSIKVPDRVSPATGTRSTVFSVVWSATTAPGGFVFDVQIERPGSGAFTSFKTGVTGRRTLFKPDHGRGTYAFRSRLRKTSNGTHSGWSPAKSISIS